MSTKISDVYVLARTKHVAIRIALNIIDDVIPNTYKTEALALAGWREQNSSMRRFYVPYLVRVTQEGQRRTTRVSLVAVPELNI